MVRRILHSLMAFGVLVVAYQAYVLLAVPWLEPPLQVRENQRAIPADRAGANPATKYQRLLANYFPHGHWSQLRPPVVISTGAVMLVLDNYDRGEEGRVDIERCALLVFPTAYQEGVAPPQDAVVVEASQGARLQFDEGFRPERGQIGQITRGEFPGKVTIRSGMQSLGPEDDLLIETSDLTMNTKLLYTASPVRFRLGSNVGGGRELEIRFLEEEHARPGKSGLKIAGISSLEMRRDVRLRLYLETDSLLPGEDRSPHRGDEDERIRRLPDAAAIAAAEPSQGPSLGGKGIATAAPSKPPVEVTCSGPFHFDFTRYVASFDRDVELRQILPDGPSDQLTAQQLDIHFAPRQEPGGQPASPVVDPAQRQKQDLGRLEPSVVVAQGYPVVVISPSRGAEARGERIQLGLRDQQVILNGGREVRLAYGPNVLRAPTIEYQHPPRTAATKIGRFRANGPGSLHYAPDPARPDEAFVAAWQTSVELGRYKGQPAIALKGRPWLSAGALGRLSADEMHVYLTESTDGKEASVLSLPGQEGQPGSTVAVLLHRMTATGDVQIESPQMTGRTNRLVALFRYQDSGNDASQTLANDAKPAANERFQLSNPNGPPGQAYSLETDELRLEIAMQGRRATPANLACNGNVVLREIPLQPTDEEPMEVRGGQLLATNLDASAHITIRGTAAASESTSSGTPPETTAQLRARGVTVEADIVELDEQENRLWIATPGKATMMVTRDLEGKAVASPSPMEIRWQGGLNFDGQAIVFDRNVSVDAAEGALRCDRLSAKLTTAIQFGGAVQPKAIDLTEIDCQGDVVVDHRMRDAAGPISRERMQLPRLVINQQTGAISGTGPGVVRSTHFGQDWRRLGGPATNGAAGPAGATSPSEPGRPRLYFLRIDFQRGLEGNLHTRTLSFLQRVRTVYGPVDSWEQELDLNQPESLPPESVLLACDELRANEDTLAASPSLSSSPTNGPVQLVAMGNVRIEGQLESQGDFGAQADRASYEQSKDVFILEGSARTPAMLWQRRGPGGEATPLYARKIHYNLESGEPKVEGIQYLEFTPSTAPTQNARNATPPSR